MKHISTAPFGRRTDAAGLSAHRTLAEAPCPATPIDKWAILRDLTAARSAFKVSDRDLTVLQALMSFHPPQMLAADTPTIVFPSNARLSERLHGMPESTLRRHIAALVAAGLILRHDSPNGKRFARRDQTGRIARAFGFDLRPLLVRVHEIANAAELAQQEAAELHALREEVILNLRDIVAISGTSDAVVEMHRCLRRKLPLDAMRDLCAESSAMAIEATSAIPVAEIPGGYDSENERHIQDSNKTLSESEDAEEAAQRPSVSLQTVLSACSMSADYAVSPMKDWTALIDTAQTVVPMMGITRDVWAQARIVMGSAVAAVTVLCILQRFERIKSPGAYLRSLIAKAMHGQFSVDAFVRSLGAELS